MATEASSSSTKKELIPTDEQIERITGRISQVRKRISQASSDAKREKEPRLVAISKLHPPTSILAAHKHCQPAQVHFGENYAQELEAKAKVLPESIQWHFVGKLQSNKAKLVASIPNLFLIETLDSIKLANALEKVRAGLEDSEPLGVYLQVNTSGEENKGGLSPLQSESEAKQSEVYKLAIHVIQECKHLQLKGVMTIGAATNSQASKEKGDVQDSEKKAEEIAAEARSVNPDFDTLYTTRQVLVKALRKSDGIQSAKDRYPTLLSGDDKGGLELSMGMSNDLEVAVRAGSDNVRVGTDCFGVRAPSRDEAMEAMKDELEA